VVVFDGPEGYHARSDDAALGIDACTLLVMPGAIPARRWSACVRPPI
jgi:dihydroxy-acid dehydratase